MHPMSPELSAWLTASLLTLMACCWLLTKIPTCNHETCNAAHKAESAREQKAEDAQRRHAWHDFTRPQAGCSLCAARKPDPPDPEP